MSPDAPATTYHLVPADYFDATDHERDYYPSYFAEEGFIHTTAEPEWVERIANRVLAEYDGRVYLIEIELARVRADVRIEQAKNGHWFPHIYGGLNRDAIRRTALLERDAAGGYRFPEAWLTA
jgi:uncharacterized protein (DUF952 family)